MVHALKKYGFDETLCIYRISANSFRVNYSFLNLTLSTVTLVTVHMGAETIQGRKLFAEIRYIHLCKKLRNRSQKE